MKYYALGKRNEQIRIIIKAADLTVPQLNLQFGEAIVQVAGDNVRGTISTDGTTIVPLGIDMDSEQALIRQMRTALLSRCDFTILPDSPLTEEQKAAWAAYRTALRNITIDQPNVLFENIVWPTPPSEL